MTPDSSSFVLLAGSPPPPPTSARRRRRLATSVHVPPSPPLMSPTCGARVPTLLAHVAWQKILIRGPLACPRGRLTRGLCAPWPGRPFSSTPTPRVGAERGACSPPPRAPRGGQRLSASLGCCSCGPRLVAFCARRGNASPHLRGVLALRRQIAFVGHVARLDARLVKVAQRDNSLPVRRTPRFLIGSAGGGGHPLGHRGRVAQRGRVRARGLCRGWMDSMLQRADWAKGRALFVAW